MKTDSAIVNTNLRLNLNRDEDRLAWDYLQNRDRTRYPSYSKTIVIALNDFFRRQQMLAEDYVNMPPRVRGLEWIPLFNGHAVLKERKLSYIVGGNVS